MFQRISKGINSRIWIFISVFFISVSLNAQKISYDLNAGILKSVGKDLFKDYISPVNPLTLTYYSFRIPKFLQFQNSIRKSCYCKNLNNQLCSINLIQM